MPPGYEGSLKSSVFIMNQLGLSSGFIMNSGAGALQHLEKSPALFLQWGFLSISARNVLSFKAPVDTC